jgi:hypothetical protein
LTAAGVTQTENTTSAREDWLTRALQDRLTEDERRTVRHAMALLKPAGRILFGNNTLRETKMEIGFHFVNFEVPGGVQALPTTLAAELFGITLGHGYGSFNGCRDQKSSKPTP